MNYILHFFFETHLNISEKYNIKNLKKPAKKKKNVSTAIISAMKIKIVLLLDKKTGLT